MQRVQIILDVEIKIPQAMQQGQKKLLTTKIFQGVVQSLTLLGSLLWSHLLREPSFSGSFQAQAGTSSFPESQSLLGEAE